MIKKIRTEHHLYNGLCALRVKMAQIEIGLSFYIFVAHFMQITD